MEIVMYCSFALLSITAFTSHVYGQNQSGFISIDCGSPEDSSYNDITTGITYMSDVTLINTGTNMSISSAFKTASLRQPFLNVRSFPEGMRNCYTLVPPNVTLNVKYLIRASFFYGDYDGQGQVPEFDLHIGINKWDSVSFSDSNRVVTKETIHQFTSKILYVCLMNTGSGTPFISLLELRPIVNDIYKNVSGALLLYKRLNYGSLTGKTVRYIDDVHDRIWEPLSSNGLEVLNSTLMTNQEYLNPYEVPLNVLATAISPSNADGSLEIYWNFGSFNATFYIYAHFAELRPLLANQSREFSIYVNGKAWLLFFSPVYLYSTTIHNPLAVIKEWLNISIYKTENSTLPPIINAIEIYWMKEFLYVQTDEGDTYAMIDIKSAYGLQKNWQGDPCAPKGFTWSGITCKNDASVSPRIISLDLSSSGLTGEISPYISNLSLLQSLDLSNNNLTGKVPDFLSHMPFLKVIKLSQNSLSGQLPEILIEKMRNGSLSLSADDTIICLSGPCIKKKNNNIVAVVTSVIASVILITVIAMLTYKKFSKKVKVLKLGKKSDLKGRLLDTTNRKFTYNEVLIITNNLERIIGKGGFGPVYYGYLEDTEVAVKMLSSSSIQGYKEFLAEIEFLTRVHHINLTSLVGYCDEGDNIGLIYEYMANGNLREHLSDRQFDVLSWRERLQIALDAATGLEYLHSSCKPPIIHRDVKSANILLDEKFQGKLADFGLSKDFPVENTHISTAIAGTPGYLDPDYYVSYKLTEKSDIFSFGIVLLEIITSRPVITRDQENAHISQWVSSMFAKEEDLRSIVDSRLGGDFEVNSVKKAIEIALACASMSSIKRPTMNHVVVELKQCLALEMARANESLGPEPENVSIVSSMSVDPESIFEAR